MPRSKPRDREQLLTRAQFIEELISEIDEAERFASGKGFKTQAAELRIALRVIYSSLRVSELMDLEALHRLEEDADIGTEQYIPHRRKGGEATAKTHT
jgi:hypothetical protein